MGCGVRLTPFTPNLTPKGQVHMYSFVEIRGVRNFRSREKWGYIEFCREYSNTPDDEEFG